MRCDLTAEVCKLPALSDSASIDSSMLTLRVGAVKNLSVPAEYSLPFPMNKAALMKAYELDHKFKAEDVTVRGLVYVFKDLTHKCLETAAFMPALVSMDNPRTFFYTKRVLPSAEWQTKLQELYAARKNIFRIVYVVSCSHTTMDNLAEDLNQYGVLQRGYTTTPSDQIELVCFDRPKMWLEGQKGKTNMPDALLTNERKRTSSGIIVSSTEDRRGNMTYHVAFDYCDDIVEVANADITKLITKYTSKTGEVRVSATEIPTGSRVEVVLREYVADSENKEDASADIYSASVASDSGLSSAEIVMVTVTMVGGGRGGRDKTLLLPFVLGRTSIPVPASQLTSPMTESMRAVLSSSYSSVVAQSMGKFGAHTMLAQGFKSMYQDAHALFISRTLSALTSTSAVAKEKHFFALVTALSTGTNTLALSALDTLLVLAHLRVSLTHPLLASNNNFWGS